MAKTLSWTQPICITCWTAREPNRTPVRLTDRHIETCAFCGDKTKAGIYVRQDPNTVPFPAEEDDQ